jgi:hypothetical protein
MQSIPPHLERILNLARWAPSGDNTQPWRFEILGDEHILVHGFDTRDHVVYDLDGHSSQLAVGALLETMSIAASAEARSASIHRRPGTPETHLLFDVHFQPIIGMAPDALVPHIETRTVQRRSMSTLALSAEQKQVLAATLPDGFSVRWHEGLGQRWLLAKFMFACAKIRLTIPEAYAQHKSIIEWGAQFSDDKVPGQAVGVDPVTERFMSWVMASWQRVDFFNTFLLGHLPPRLQLELLPSLRCGAHFALSAPAPLRSIDDYLAAGRAMQRFWLSVAKIGWFIQPEMTSVIFARYHRRGIAFSTQQAALALAARLNDRLAEIVGLTDIDRVYFVARIGAGPRPMARSTRKAVTQLLMAPPPSPVT